MTALLTCGHTRASLAAVRSIGRAGHAVAVGGQHRPSLAMWSRYSTTSLLLPEPLLDPKAFVMKLAEETSGRRIHAVFPGTDAALWAISKWRELMPDHVLSCFPPHEAVARIHDRATLHDLATTLDIPCVNTFRVAARSEVEPVIRKAREIGLPALVRPLIPVEERMDGTRRVADVYPVGTVAELRRLLYDRNDIVAGGCLIEPRPQGQTIGYGAIFNGGKPVVEIFQERLREREVLSGVSTVAKTIAPDFEIRHIGRRILEALDWTGPAMIEFIRVKATQEVQLVNIVGRLWGSVQLAISAGIDVPRLCYRMAKGRRVPTGLVAKSGVQFRWILGDFSQMLERAASNFDPYGTGFRALRRLEPFAEFAHPKYFFRSSYDVLDRDDPMPFLFECQRHVQSFGPFHTS